MGSNAGASNPAVPEHASDLRVLRDTALDAVAGGDAKQNELSRCTVTMYTEMVKITITKANA